MLQLRQLPIQAIEDTEVEVVLEVSVVVVEGLHPLVRV